MQCHVKGYGKEYGNYHLGLRRVYRCSGPGNLDDKGESDVKEHGG